MRARQLIRFTRRFEDSSVRGYVLAIGPKIFILSLVSDRIWFGQPPFPTPVSVRTVHGAAAAKAISKQEGAKGGHC
jgi:hypothetical protein